MIFSCLYVEPPKNGGHRHTSFSVDGLFVGTISVNGPAIVAKLSDSSFMLRALLVGYVFFLSLKGRTMLNHPTTAALEPLSLKASIHTLGGFRAGMR